MGSISENQRIWGQEFDWKDGGEGWSDLWGGSRAQWETSIQPRLRHLLPAAVIVEIGCGFGRWSAFLRPLATERLHLVDLAERCVDAVRRRFRDDAGVVAWLGDGRTLPELPPGSVDLVFSFDSLVHVELEELTGYLAGIERVLSPKGAAFLHHSNFKALLDARPGTYNHHWRAESVAAVEFAAACARLGLACRSQELVDWGMGEQRVVDGDCLSVVVRAGDEGAADPVRVSNRHFMAEAASSGLRQRLYVPVETRSGSGGGGRSSA